MIEVIILIPVTDNNKVIFTGSEWDRWEQHLERLFGGFTLLPPIARGGWLDKNRKRVADSTRLYAVFLRDITHGGKVGEAVEIAKRDFRQDAISIRYLGLAAIL